MNVRMEQRAGHVAHPRRRARYVIGPYRRLALLLLGAVAQFLAMACGSAQPPIPPPTTAPARRATQIAPITDTAAPTSTSLPPTITYTPAPTTTPVPPTLTHTPLPTRTRPPPTRTSTPVPPTPTGTPPPTTTPVPPEASVVLIEAIRPLFEEEFTVGGTGMIYDESGLVLTAAHVVDGASIIKVQVPGLSHAVPARLEGINPCQDLAIVRIVEEGPFAPATFGSSANVRPGDEVRVIAFPGDADSLEDLSVSRGIVNRVGAEGVVITGLTYPDLIGTDAAVEPGNSGGPLLAWEGPDKGNVIGVVLLRGGEEEREIGYAVPVDQQEHTIAQLVEGHREYWLGTLMIPLEFLALLVPDLEFTWDVSGMVVFGVYPDSPADEVGMQSGDVLMEMKGIETASMDEVCGVLASSPPGDPISIVVWREGTILEGKLFSDSALEPSPARRPTTAPAPRPAPTQPPHVELDFNARGYEQWGRPVGQPNPCRLFDNSSGVRKFNMDITVTNKSQELITHWFPAFYANTGRELLTCWYTYGDTFPSVPAGGSAVVTFAVFAELGEYVSEVRLIILGREYRRCYSSEGATMDCP